MNNKKTRVMLLVVAGIIFVATVFVIVTFSGWFEKGEGDTIKVGFIMSGSSTEQGWNGLHYAGIYSACKELNIELLIKENIKENLEQCKTAIRELAVEDVDIIILSSYGYAAEVLDVVKEYPDITFYSESFDYYGDNLNCYFARIYEARYLAGIIAGMKSETGCVGYVAAMPNSEVNRGINAFTLGVKKVNPEAKVIVAWSNSWDDADKEKDLAKKLIDEKSVDVITYHQNMPNVIEIAEDRDVYSIGYHENYDGASDKFLTAVEFKWDVTYKELLLDYIRGKSDVVNTYWFGMDKGAVGLTDMSPVISQDVLSEVEAAKLEIVSGYAIFSGKIYDNNGVLRCDDGEIVSDQILMKSMDWYVKGVEVYEE